MSFSLAGLSVFRRLVFARLLELGKPIHKQFRHDVGETDQREPQCVDEDDRAGHVDEEFECHTIFCLLLLLFIDVWEENSESGLEAPRHAARLRQMRFDFGPLEFDAAADFVVGQNPALHPVIHRADPLVESPRDLFFADETFGQRRKDSLANPKSPGDSTKPSAPWTTG